MTTRPYWTLSHDERMRACSLFVQGLFEDALTYGTPACMSLDDAARNLAGYIADGLPVPADLTPALLAWFWNDAVRDEVTAD